jgi:hypothetical protein
MGPVRYGAFHAGRSSLQIWYSAYLMACAPDCPCQFDHTVYIKPQQLYLRNLTRGYVARGYGTVKSP